MKARICKQNFSCRITLLPATTVAGNDLVNLVNMSSKKYFNRQTLFTLRLRSRFISSIEVISILNSLKIPDSNFYGDGNVFDRKTLNNLAMKHHRDSSDKHSENVVSKTHYSNFFLCKANLRQVVYKYAVS